MTDASPAELKIARCVTRRHGARFAKAWFDVSMETEFLCDEAFAEAGVVDWPDRYLDHGYTPEQKRYHDLEKEILRRTFAAVRPDIAAAFIKAAADVLRDRRSSL